MVLALNIRQSSQALEAFNQAHHYTLPILMDPGGYTAYAYGVSGIPTTFFIDRTGIIRAVQYGAFANMAALNAQLSKITGTRTG